jgi:hypothetical protein
LNDNRVEKPRGIPVPQQVLIALVLGIASGLFFGELLAWLKPVGDVFIKLLQITVIPFLSLDQVRALAREGGIILLSIWILVIAVLFLFPLAFPDWRLRRILEQQPAGVCAHTRFHPVIYTFKSF